VRWYHGDVRETHGSEVVMGRLTRAAAGAALAAGGAALYLRVYRPWQTRWGASDAEVTRFLPGDEIVGRPTWNATRAVTVAATPAQIWPFLVQIGWGRAGWYGYDRVDNGGRPSTWEILPEWQGLEIGKEFPMSPVTFMVCVDFRENEWMLWRGKDADVDALSRRGVSSGTWLWYLDPVDETHTRLITRMRDRYRWTSPYIAVQLAVDAFDFPFMRKVLLGIKARAEAWAVRQAGDHGQDL
jgi:hypothetical protein